MIASTRRKPFRKSTSRAMPKKWSQQKRNIFLRHQQRKLDHKLARKEKRNSNSKRAQYTSTTGAYNQSTISKKITLPANWSLHNNYEQVILKINELRNRIESSGPRLQNLVLDEVKEIGISAALIMAAELEVWNMRINNKLHSRHKKWDAVVRKLLCDMGLFDLLDIPRPDVLEDDATNTVFLRFISGQQVDGAKAKELREKIEEAIGKQLSETQRNHLFEGLSEACTNTKQHAYGDDESLNAFEKWWVTAAYDRLEKTLRVAIYDRGKSIPSTIRRYKKWAEMLRHMQGDYRDNHARLIQAAMDASFRDDAGSTRSRTRKSYRGSGLKQLSNFIDGNGKLTIISNAGYCQFEVKRDKLKTLLRKTLKNALRGTLIEWQTQL